MGLEVEGPQGRRRVGPPGHVRVADVQEDDDLLLGPATPPMVTPPGVAAAGGTWRRPGGPVPGRCGGRPPRRRGWRGRDRPRGPGLRDRRWSPEPRHPGGWLRRLDFENGISTTPQAGASRKTARRTQSSWMHLAECPGMKLGSRSPEGRIASFPRRASRFCSMCFRGDGAFPACGGNRLISALHRKALGNSRSRQPRPRKRRPPPRDVIFADNFRRGRSQHETTSSPSVLFIAASSFWSCSQPSSAAETSEPECPTRQRPG